MNGRPSRLLVRLLEHRRRVLAVFAVLAALLGIGLLRLESDNSPEIFFVRGSEATARYQRFVDDFGRDEMLRVALRGGALWTVDGLSFVAEFEDRIAGVGGVRAVSGPAALARRLEGWAPADPASVRGLLLRHPTARRFGWIGDGGELVTLTVLLDRLEPAARDVLLAEIETLLEAAPPGVDGELVGLPVLNRALDRSSREIGTVYFPLLVLLSVVLLLAVVRDPIKVLVPLVFVGGCELWLLGTMGFAGVKLNLILAILPPLLFAIALATAVHVLLRFRDLWQEDALAACVETFREKSWAVLWTGLTTLIGFLSLAASPVAPVRALGLWAAWGLLGMTLAALTVYPALLGMVASGRPRPGHRAFEGWASSAGRRWAVWATRRRGLVLAAALLVVLGSAMGWARLRVESNALTYLALEHPARAGIEQLEAAGIGVATVELVVEGDALESADLGRLAVLAERLESISPSLAVVDLGTLVGDAAAGMILPGASPAQRRMAALAALEGDADGRRLVRAFLSEDRRRARITLFVRLVGADQLDGLVAAARREAGEFLPEARVEITGQLPLLLETQRHLVSTLALSLGLTLLAVGLIFRFLLRGTRLALLALVPNLWPVLVLFGIMGWADVPLDIATVMVASIVLGLAVDDTLHTLGHFRREAPICGAREAVARTLAATAPAYLLTALILAAGFGVCGLSEFAPTARFGVLASIAVGLALLGDLLLLPALLSLAPRKTIQALDPQDKEIA